MFWKRGCEPDNHRFQARYDERPGVVALIEAANKAGGIMKSWSGAEPDAERTYVRDVCARCGKTVERGR